MATLQALDGLLHEIDINEQKDNIASKVPCYELNHQNRKITMPAIGFGLYNVTEIEKITLSALQVHLYPSIIFQI